MRSGIAEPYRTCPQAQRAATRAVSDLPSRSPSPRAGAIARRANTIAQRWSAVVNRPVHGPLFRVAMAAAVNHGCAAVPFQYFSVYR